MWGQQPALLRDQGQAEVLPGERWAALNSKVPHSDAERLIAATEAAIDPYRERMTACGVTMSFLYIAIAQHVFSYEPVLRWFDEWLPVHRHVPEPNFLSELKEPSPNHEGRALVDEALGGDVPCTPRSRMPV